MNLLESREFLNQLITSSDLPTLFQTTKSNQERLNIVFEHLKKEGAFLEYVKGLNERDVKNYELSFDAKSAGIKDFAAKNCHLALLSTNESLSLAPKSADFLPHLYGNRSAILFDLKCYQDCIVNIEIALASAPPNLIPKLLFRKVKCLICLNKHEEAKSVYEHCLEEMERHLSAIRSDRSDPEVMQYEEMRDRLTKSWTDLSEDKCLEGTPTEGARNKKSAYKNHQGTLKEGAGKKESDCEDRGLDLTLLNKNADFPVASAQIALSANSQFGRSVFAAQDIPPGQLIVVEPARVSAPCPARQIRLTHCHFCLKRTLNCSVPCDRCDALFCDESCRRRSYESSHQAECRVLQAVRQMPLFGMVETLALRFCLQETKQGRDIDALWAKLPTLPAAETPDENAGSLAPVVIPNETEKGSTLKVDSGKNAGHSAPPVLPNKAGKHGSFAVTSDLAFLLETNEPSRSSADMVARVFKATVLCQLLRLNAFFPGDDTVPFGPQARRFGALLVHYFQVVACNAHDINMFFTSRECPMGEQVQIGSGLYPFCSMFNHSCDPNVVRHSTDGTTVLVTTLKVVRKGEQLFDNYGCHFATHTKAERQAYLWEQYRFHCACQACVEDFPLYSPEEVEEPFTFGVATFGGASPDGLKEELRRSAERFKTVLSEMVANGHNLSDVRGKYEVCVRHLKLINEWVARPHREFEKCQETYKRILCYLTNCAALQDGEEIP